MEISDIYLKGLKIDNYKSLKDSTIELQKGLNIIIGKNGVGKSNLLDFINRFVGWNPLTFPFRSLNTNFSISIAYELNNEKNVISYNIERSKREERLRNQEQLYNYELTLNKQINDQSVIDNKKIKFNDLAGFGTVIKEDKLNAEFNEILVLLRQRYITFELPDDTYWLSKTNRLIVEPNSETFETEPIFLRRFTFFEGLEFYIEFNIERNTKKSQELNQDLNLLKKKISDYINDYLERTSINFFLKNYTPITEIRFNPNLNIYSHEETIVIENFLIEFLINGDWMPWSYLSDGTKRLFYLVSECLTINHGTISIEEPELGVHPHQLSKILDFLKEQSRTKQIIISTHSPLSLDILDENELDKLIIASYDKGTRFHKLTTDEINKAKRYINEVGELSYYWLHSDLEK
jgi:predicted ATP-dependent endonuclease of OLD family